MPRALVMLSFVFLSSVVATRAQQTSLQATLSQDPMGHPRVTLTNPRSADARAYIVECGYASLAGQTVSRMVIHEGLGGPPYTVWVGKSERIACFPNTIHAVVKAVVYDDEKAEGDPQLLAQIAAERQFESQDVTQDIQILQDALGSAESSAGPTAASNLARQFFTRAQQHTNTQIGNVPQDFVCTWVAEGLASPIRKQSLAWLIRGQIAALQKFQAALAKPIQMSGQIPN
jgi:hypothetical protein